RRGAESASAAATIDRGSVAARRRGSVAARRRGSVAARRLAAVAVAPCRSRVALAPTLAAIDDTRAAPGATVAHAHHLAAAFGPAAHTAAPGAVSATNHAAAQAAVAAADPRAAIDHAGAHLAIHEPAHVRRALPHGLRARPAHRVALAR